MQVYSAARRRSACPLAGKAPDTHAVPPSSRMWIESEEYGVFSFDGKRLPNYIAYVERQKEHHTQHTTIPILERTEGEMIGLLRESVTP